MTLNRTSLRRLGQELLPQEWVGGRRAQFRGQELLSDAVNLCLYVY